MRKYRFLILRRISQIGILAAFAVCNYFGYKFFLGNLSQSSVFWIVPLSDPLSILQILMTGAIIGLDALLGLLVVAIIYGAFLGRGYCAFVCPMNLITDFIALLRRKLGINTRYLNVSKSLKYYILALSLILSFLLGVAAFDMLSPISMLHRSVIYGLGFGIFGVVLVALFDLVILKNGFCGYICPLGATYSLLGKYSLLKIKHESQNCTKCMECVNICPEPQVLSIVGKESGSVDKIECLKCGRCVEVCDDNALKFGISNLLKEKK